MDEDSVQSNPKLNVIHENGLPLLYIHFLISICGVPVACVYKRKYRIHMFYNMI
jgi:hypothetical protein